MPFFFDVGSNTFSVYSKKFNDMVVLSRNTLSVSSMIISRLIKIIVEDHIGIQVNVIDSVRT